MTSYFIKSGLCLGLLLVFYHLFLEREKMHQFNRFYLLGSVLFSFLAPLFVIYVEPKEIIEVPLVTKATTGKIEHQTLFTLQNIMLGIYTIGVLFLSIRFIKNIFDISFKISRNEKLKLNNATLVLVDDEILPHTFWNYIFINKKEFQKNEIEEELFTHELAHVTQKHTIDVILLELTQIVLWFNPFIIWLKKAVQLNHEFLADDSVISSHQNISYYQTLLLDKAAWNNKFYLASNLNYSLTKKRLKMMKTPSSKLSILLKKLALLPLLIGFVFVFANRVEAQTKKKPTVIEVKEVEKSATRAQMKEYNKLLENAQKTKMFKLDDIKRMRYLHSLMSAKQKKSTKSIYDFIPPPPPRPTKIVVKEVEKKGKKAPKPVKIEVVKKGKKNEKIIIEEIEDEDEDEGEVEEKEEEIEIVETSDWDNIKKKLKHSDLDEEEEVDIIKHKKGDHDFDLDSEITHYKNTKYYINNKKVSKKKARKLMKNKNKVKTIEIVKENNKAKVLITTK